MKAITCWIVVVLVCASSAWAVDIEWVTVGDPGNAGELSGEGAGGWGPDRICGAVDYVYNIGKFEITVGQYTEFLNAVAADDTYELYDTSMWTQGCKIERTGSSGSYSYAVAPDWANRPVNYATWGDAARFANWMHNGQPSGPQDLSTTEDGAYLLDGAISDAALMAVTRKPDARVFIPSEDEWYKAAYYDSVAGVYYDYPTGSDTSPTSEVPPGTDMTNGSANYYSYSGGHTIGSPYHRTEVGAHDAKPSGSPYGTFDQGGNEWEWTESVLFGSYRGLRGGAFSYYDYYMHAAYRDTYWPPQEDYPIGFRVAGVFEPVPAASPRSLGVLAGLICCGGVVVLRRAF